MVTAMTRDEIVENLGKLTMYDREDVFKYMDTGVYYLGNSCKKTEQSPSYDEFGYYYTRKGDHILYRFEVLEILGRGSYCVVVCALDHKLMIEVAIKVMKRGPLFDEKYFQEVEIYDYLNVCFNNEVKELGQMLEHFFFREHGCIVLKKCYKDLGYKIGKYRFKGLGLAKVKKIVRSILKGVKALHDVNLIHGDLKPDNIALRERNSSEITILDLGNSKFGYKPFERYDQGRFYRAPETILKLTQGPGIDIWALGCIAFELATGMALFQGEQKDDQLIRIMEVLGVPPKNIIKRSSVAAKYFYNYRVPKYCHKKVGKRKYKPCTRNSAWHSPKTINPFLKLKKESPLFVNFLKKCFKWNARNRMTATEALFHKWIMRKRLQNADFDANRFTRLRKVKNSISSHTVLKRPLRNVFPKACENKTKRTLSLMDCKQAKFDVHARWLQIRSKYLNETYNRRIL